MFASEGFFRGVTCPFFASGLCHRPYCHFKHARALGKFGSLSDSRLLGLISASIACISILLWAGKQRSHKELSKTVSQVKEDATNPVELPSEEKAASTGEVRALANDGVQKDNANSGEKADELDAEVDSLTAKAVEKERPQLFSDSPSPPLVDTSPADDESARTLPSADIDGLSESAADTGEKVVPKAMAQPTYQSLPEDFGAPFEEVMSADNAETNAPTQGLCQKQDADRSEEQGKGLSAEGGLPFVCMPCVPVRVWLVGTGGCLA